jgi:hypothetical protein
MKKQIGLLVILSVLTISCGGKNEKKDGVSEESESPQVENCGCDELSALPYYKGITKEGEKGLYSGTCTDKDQNDTIMRKAVIKNGFLITDKEKIKVGGTIIAISDISCDNGNENNGWKMDFPEDGWYTKGYSEYKNGKLLNSYEVKAYKSGDDEPTGLLCVLWKVKNGANLEYTYTDDETEEFLLKSKPKCMPDSKAAGYYSNNKGWVMEELNNEDLFKIMAELKKELPRFIYIN